MKDKKFEIGVIILMIVVPLVLLGVYLLIDLINKSKSYTLFLEPFSIIECKKWDCKDVSEKLTDYNNKEYNVYINGKLIGINDVYYNSANNKYYVFNKNSSDNVLNKGDVFMAYKGNADVRHIMFEVKEASYEDIYAILEKSKLKINFSDIGYSKVIDYDFDDDGEIEKLITLGDSSIDVNEIYFSIMAYIDNGKVFIIDETKKEEMYEIMYNDVSNLLDIFNDSKIEFINRKVYRDNLGYCNVVYRLKGKKFVPVNECEIIQNRG